MHSFLLTLLFLAAAPEVELRTLEGDVVAGKLLGLSIESIALETADGKVTVETDKLLGVAPKEKAAVPSGAAAVRLELLDGSLVLGKQYTVANRKATLTLLDDSTMEFDTRDIAAVRLQAAGDAIDKEWQRIVEGKHAADVIVVRKDETADYHKGVLHDVNETTVTFELDGEKIPVKRTKVFGLFYYHAERDIPAALCVAVGTDGSRWSVRTLALGDGVEWTTPCGMKVKRPMNAVANLDFSGGKILFLSDLKADAVQWTPYFGTAQPLPAVSEFYAPRMDQNMSGKTIQIRGEKFAKGLAIHSRTEMVYRLPGRFSRFRAVAGIDDEVAPNGHVQLVIRGDDKVLFEGPIAGADKAKPLDLDLSGVKRLTILVDFGEKLDVADHLVLGMARISK